MLHLNFDIKYLILKYLHLIVDYRKKITKYSNYLRTWFLNSDTQGIDWMTNSLFVDFYLPTLPDLLIHLFIYLQFYCSNNDHRPFKVLATPFYRFVHVVPFPSSAFLLHYDVPHCWDIIYLISRPRQPWGCISTCYRVIRISPGTKPNSGITSFALIFIVTKYSNSSSRMITSIRDSI